MEITLEKIELVKDRTGVTYKEAKEALEAADGSVVDAIIAIEESIGTKPKFKIGGENGPAQQVVDKIKALINKGHVSKIVIKRDEEIIVNLPVTIGVAGAVIAPWAIVIGAITAFGTKCVVEVIKDDGSIIDVSEIANETFDEVVEKGSVIADEVMTKGTDVYNSVVSKTSEALNKVKKDKESSDFSFSDDFNGADNSASEEDK